MVEERRRAAQVGRHLLNHLTILLPTLEGLCQITVQDGKQGHIFFRYAPSAQEDMERLWAYLSEKYGEAFVLGETLAAAP
ncbi:hypothetical protein [Acanthopleuribacter pedis]|uniref:Uncharacterized protein n=1 Tax=Acanthopleuribacter pedis TaxID=442870 RepID=A0A8J7PY72_9BACT|nr:hypothetical protein [Acanthopleuribacter pedis]MBO1316837.1 hypothetical protein [Acanthopleuribacter pedis]